MDSEKLKQYLIPILLIIVTFLVLFFLGSKIVSNVQGLLVARAEYESNNISLKQAQEKLEKLKKAETEKAKQESANIKTQKPFYKPVMSGMDSEAAIAGEFTEILELVRENKIKVRSIKYDYDPQDDNFVKGNASKYNVARLNMEIVTNYTDFDNFLKELYKHEHFLEIQSVEIVPYRKNKRILLINFKLKLYAKK